MQPHNTQSLYTVGATIYVDDPLQPDYSYVLTAPVGILDPMFTPDLTPQQMLEVGVFGGHYFEQYIDEFPSEWFAHVHVSDAYDPACNYFHVRASQNRDEWQRRGWLYHEDPRGWFQWYCRYYLGRRIPSEDTRQINRWRAVKRHVAQLQSACAVGDQLCRPRQRQALLHWAYDSRIL